MFTLHDIVICLGTFTILVSFVMAVYVRKRTGLKYLQIFYFCPLIALLISINTLPYFYFDLFSSRVLFFLQNLLFLLDLLFWNIFFVFILKDKKEKIILKVAVFLLFLFLAILYYYENFFRPLFLIFSVSNLWKSFMCIVYYNSLFNSKPNLLIRKEPLFWIITGLFFFSNITLPQYSLHDYLKKQLPLELSNNLFSSTNISIIIMHLLFIKAYTCLLNKYLKNANLN